MFRKIVFLILVVSLVISCKSEKKEPLLIEGSTNPKLDELTAKLNSDPNNAELLFDRAALYYENDAYDESIADISQAIKIDSLKPEYYHLLADNYMDYYKSRQALETMEKASNLFPKRIETLLKLSEFQLILKQYEGGQLTIQRIFQVDPQNAEGYLMGGHLFKEVKDLDKARAGFQKAIELGLTSKEDLIDAYLNLGQLNLKKDKKLAKLYFDNALRVDSLDKSAIHGKAEYFVELGQLKEALALYRKIIVSDPSYSEAFYNSGIIYNEMDSLKKAFDNFDIAIKSDPMEAAYYFARGDVLERMGKKQEAAKDFAQAAKLNPQFKK